MRRRFYLPFRIVELKENWTLVLSLLLALSTLLAIIGHVSYWALFDINALKYMDAGDILKSSLTNTSLVIVALIGVILFAYIFSGKLTVSGILYPGVMLPVLYIIQAPLIPFKHSNYLAFIGPSFTVGLGLTLFSIGFLKLQFRSQRIRLLTFTIASVTIGYTIFDNLCRATRLIENVRYTVVSGGRLSDDDSLNIIGMKYLGMIGDKCFLMSDNRNEITVVEADHLAYLTLKVIDTMKFQRILHPKRRPH